MKVLIVGGGGREHALAWKVAQSNLVDHVFVAPGNAGTDTEQGITNVPLVAEDIEGLLDYAKSNAIDLTIVGPEAPLVDGIVDRFESENLVIFGPSASASQLEGSKTFSKEFLTRHNIPTAIYQSFTDIEPAIKYLEAGNFPVVIKADGLAAGKGVVIAESLFEGKQTVQEMLSGNRFGDAGHRIVIEEFLTGEEASFICIVDGEDILPMATSQDHKARDDGDLGPNTGGMGAYSPAPVVSDEIFNTIIDSVIRPTVKGMAAENARYRGFLYAGLMIDNQGQCKVLEFNCRFGDPETQPIMMRLKSDLASLCLAACEGRLSKESAIWDDRFSLGVVMAAAGYPDQYAKGDIIANLPAETESGKIFHAGTSTDADHNLLTNGGRVLCAVALGDSLSSAQSSAYSLVQQVDWNGSYYRTDIGFKALT
jgi:phosphoribosylamine---glycine ligase